MTGAELADVIEHLARRATHETLYAEEGTPHIYRDWAGRKIIVATVRAPDWHEDRICGGREAFANAELWALLRNHLPAILAALRSERPAVDVGAVERVGYALYLADPRAVVYKSWAQLSDKLKEHYGSRARAALAAAQEG